MLRTQIYLPKELYKNVQLLAKREKKPTAQVVRELLVESLARKQGETVGKALLALKGVGGKGPADLSSKIDAYLYEV